MIIPSLAAIVVAALALVVFALTRDEKRPAPVARAPQPSLDALASPDAIEVIDAIDSAVQHGQRVPTLVLYHPNPVVVRRALAVLDGRDLHTVMPYLLAHRDAGIRSAAQALA